MRKRSEHVAVGVATLLAVAMTGCGRSSGSSFAATDRRCVDDRNVVLDDQQCRAAGRPHYNEQGQCVDDLNAPMEDRLCRNTSGPHYYYGGRGSGRIGSVIRGGQVFIPPGGFPRSGGNNATNRGGSTVTNGGADAGSGSDSSATSRGGLGSSANGGSSSGGDSGGS